MKKFVRRAAKIILVLMVSGFMVLFIGWQGFIYFKGRISPMKVSNVPSCVGISDINLKSEIQKARMLAKALKTESSIPGLSIAVSKDGRIIWSEGFGYLDSASRSIICPDNQMRLASLSKPLTAACLMRLVDKQIIDPEVDIRQYVPEFPDKGAGITSKLLASHRGGIRSYFNDDEAMNTTAYNSVIESLDKFKNDPLAFNPGSRFLYSGYGYVLLSAVIEKASGQSFLSAMQKEVFEPLRMYHTEADSADNKINTKVKFYDYVTPYSTDGTTVASPFIDFSCKWAAGGFLSSAEDLVMFGDAFMAPGFLSGQSRKNTFRAYSRHGGGIMGYGLGWMVARDPCLRKACFHFGAGSGTTSFLVVYPEQKVSIAILGNLGHAKYKFKYLFSISNCFLSKPVKYLFILGDLVILMTLLLIIIRHRKQ